MSTRPPKPRPPSYTGENQPALQTWLTRSTGETVAYQSSDKAEHAVEQETHGRENLEKRLREESPQRVELLLGVRHALDLAPGIVDGLADGARELFQRR